MSAERVEAEDDYYAGLAERGLVKTTESTQTGTFWCHKNTGKHLLVPHSIQGFYPRWLVEDLEQRIKAISDHQ